MNSVLFGAEDGSCPPVPLPVGADNCLSGCLEQGRLHSDGRPLDLSDFDVDALRLAEQALVHNSPVLICPPDPFAPLSALVAAAAHVEAMVRLFRQSGRASRSTMRIGVVTSDFRLRGFYRGLGVAWRRGSGGVPMKSIVPAATLVSGGRLSVVDDDTGCWSTAFVGSVREAESLGSIDLLVIDLPVPDADRLAGVMVPAMVIARDPLDPQVTALAGRMPVFAYDGYLRSWHQELSDAMTFARLANHRDRRVRIVGVPAPEICANAALFWNDIPTLVRLSRRSSYIAALVREAFVLFHDLLGLAMPLAAYTNLTVRPLDRRVADLARAAKVIADHELREDWLPMVEAELAGMLQAIGGSSVGSSTGPGGPGGGRATKTGALQAAVAQGLDDRRDVLVVTRTAALSRAYTEYLQGCGLGAARVTSLGALAEVRPGEVAVLLGMAPTWGRSVYRSGAGQEIVVLAYTPAAPGGVRDAPGGPGELSGLRFDEARMVATAVELQDAAGRRMSDPVQRARAWASLCSGGGGGAGISSHPVGQDPGSADHVEIITLTPPEVPPGLWDGSGWTASLEPTAVSDINAAGESGVADLSPGFRATFSDGSWAWLADRSQVWRWRQHAGVPQQIDAASLEVGDDVLFIDSDAHKSLLTKILDVAEGIPELAVAAGWHSHWRAILRRAHEQCGSYAALTRRLHVLGCGVQEQTVRLWCIGATIGPDDCQDVRRVAEIAGDTALAEQEVQVRRAMQTLRNAHVRTGKRLAVLARSVGPSARSGSLPADEIVDPASGLTAGDLGAAVSLLRLTRTKRHLAVPAILTGRRRSAGEPSELLISSQLHEGERS